MRRRQTLQWLAIGAVAPWLPTLAGAEDAAPPLFDAQGFRNARYRTPVDRDPAPARRLALVDALRLRPDHDAVFVDVLPAGGGVRDAASGRWRLAEPHQTIPGAKWYPETGWATVDPTLWSGLLGVVTATRRRHPHWPIILFCRADCWMSWNAARRLALAGVENVWWFAEGIEGWHEAGRPLRATQPEATPDARRGSS